VVGRGGGIGEMFDFRKKIYPRMILREKIIARKYLAGKKSCTIVCLASHEGVLRELVFRPFPRKSTQNYNLLSV